MQPTSKTPAQRSREWRHRNPKWFLLHSARKRSIKKGLDFDLVPDDVPDIPAICPIAFIPIYPRDDGRRGPCDNSPTLDRIDPTRGYIKGNVRVISHRGNRWKSEMTVDDVKRLLEYMLS